MIINHNITALKNFNQIKKQTHKSEAILQKLSSGMRINRASDDSAGLAISEKMRAQIRGLNQAQKNIQDGISLLQTAEGALSQILNPPLQRMRELVIQSENDSLTRLDRLHLQKEMDELKNTINDIARNTHFNNKYLIDGSYNGEISVLTEAIPAQISGNVDLSEGMTIVQGVNDTLNLIIDDISYTIRLEAGQYHADEFINQLNTQFIKENVNVSATYQNNQLSLLHGIDDDIQLSGKLVESLFLTFEEGQSFAGAITKSVTSKSNLSFADPQYGTIIEGVNDSLIITLNEEDYEITLTPGTYLNGEQFENELNARFNESGLDVQFHNYYISGGTLGINMLENNEAGIMRVSGNAASFIFTYKWGDDWLFGNKDLSNGLSIIENQNDILELTLDGHDYSFKLDSGTYTSQQLINELNSHFTEQNVKLSASIHQGYSDDRLAVEGSDIKVLKIDRTSAETGNVNAIQFSGTAFTDLFLHMDGQEGVIEQSFKVTGNRDLSNGLMIEEGMNDSLSFLVDDVHKTIQLSEGTYTSEELIDEINHRLTEKNAGVSASYSDNRLVFRHHTAGENHKISQFSGNAFTSLFFSSEKGKDAVLTEPNQVQFQIGANSGNSISLHFMNTETTAIGVDSLSVIDAPNRKGALSKIDKAIEMISSERSTIGVIQNRLEYTINNLSTYSENLTAAESRIRDLDMAREIMAQTKNSILTQASQAMLAQSNQIPQGVLQLLR